MSDIQPLTDEEVEKRIVLLREYNAAVEMHFHCDSVSINVSKIYEEARDKFFMAFSRDDIARLLARIRADGKRIERLERAIQNFIDQQPDECVHGLLRDYRCRECEQKLFAALALEDKTK